MVLNRKHLIPNFRTEGRRAEIRGKAALRFVGVGNTDTTNRPIFAPFSQKESGPFATNEPFSKGRLESEFPEWVAGIMFWGVLVRRVEQ